MAAACLALAGCKDDNKEQPWGEEYSFEAVLTSNNPWDWAYISLAEGTVVDETGDWDIAVSLYHYAKNVVKTRSGVVVDGVVRADAEYAVPAIGGNPTTGFTLVQLPGVVWSGIFAVDFVIDPADPNYVMPPSYKMLPANVFVSHDGTKRYKVQFTGFSPTAASSRNVRIALRVEEV